MVYKDPLKQKAYFKAYSAKWYRRNKKKTIARVKTNLKIKKQWLADYKTTLKCSRCPESHPATLDFHHRNPQDKDDAIGQLIVNGVSMKRLTEEIAKCDVLCSNCHRKLHWNEKLVPVIGSAPISQTL